MLSCVYTGGLSKKKHNAVMLHPLVPLIMHVNIILSIFITHTLKSRDGL